MHEEKLMQRIRAVNMGHIEAAELIYCQLHADGHGAVMIGLYGRKRSHMTQFFISKPLGKSLVSGRANQNLDAKLRL